MVSYNKFETFVKDLGEGAHQCHSAGHQFKVYATDAAPSASADSVKGDLLEITSENGYPSGGSDMTNDYTEASGTGTFTATDVVWTATGGSFGALQYVVAYNDTQTSPADPLMCWWNYGSSVTVNHGETFTVDFGASVWTLT